MEVSQTTLVTAATLKPVTLVQAKKQCEVPADDTTHDDQLTLLIDVATDQFENDCDICLLTQTQRVYAEEFSDDEIYLPKRPVQSIASIKYYDDANTQQTLSASVYSLNAPERSVELVFNQVWPSVATDRWDAVEITYVCGYSSAVLVPASARHAVLLLVGYYFGQNRGDNDRPNDMEAYRRLVKQFLRSNYP